MLICHSFLAEFRGETAEDLILALHRSSWQGTGETLEQWWLRQQQLWSRRYGMSVPGRTEIHAAEKMLKVLIEVGALEEGPSPVAVPVMEKNSPVVLFRNPPQDECTRRLGDMLKADLLQRWGKR